MFTWYWWVVGHNVSNMSLCLTFSLVSGRREIESACEGMLGRSSGVLRSEVTQWARPSNRVVVGGVLPGGTDWGHVC